MRLKMFEQKEFELRDVCLKHFKELRNIIVTVLTKLISGEVRVKV